MWTADEYGLSLPGQPHWISAAAEQVYRLGWRSDFSAPGFCLLDAGAVDSHTLRSWMVDLKERLSEISVLRGRRPFGFRSMARFDQQETTKFHRDGAPEQSLLMLGYEPSKVRSRLFLADYSRAAFDLDITPEQFLQDFNPMYHRGEELLSRYITELPQPADGHARILLVNNSSLPFSEDRRNSLGVLHKAEIVNPTASERRIVNLTLLVVADADEIGREQRQEFVTTEKISQKTY
jgi:hypothetical protein